jgi:hypothetical protein
MVDPDKFFADAFAIARALADLLPPPPARPEPPARPTFAYAVCDRCLTGVRLGAFGRYVSTVVAPNGDPGKCSSGTWWRTIAPGVLDAHPDEALTEAEEPEWDECPGCRCHLGMAPCGHCTDHLDEDEQPTPACDLFVAAAPPS